MEALVNNACNFHRLHHPDKSALDTYSSFCSFGWDVDKFLDTLCISRICWKEMTLRLALLLQQVPTASTKLVLVRLFLIIC